MRVHAPAYAQRRVALARPVEAARVARRHVGAAARRRRVRARECGAGPRGAPEAAAPSRARHPAARAPAAACAPARRQEGAQAALALVVAQRVQVVGRQQAVAVGVEVREHPAHLGLAVAREACETARVSSCRPQSSDRPTDRHDGYLPAAGGAVAPASSISTENQSRSRFAILSSAQPSDPVDISKYLSNKIH